VHGGLLGGFRLAKIQKLEAPLLLLLPIMAAAAAACYRTAAARLLAGSAAPAAGTVTRCCCCSARGALWVASFVFGGRVHHHHHHHHPRGREAVAGAGRLFRFSSVTTCRHDPCRHVHHYLSLACVLSHILISISHATV
jgi:hypothetical protein